MDTNVIIRYSSNAKQDEVNVFEEAFYDSLCQYSLRDLPFAEEISQENILEALQKSLQVCYLAGINSKQHFKQIYIYDDNIKTIHIDWKMSKRAVNLMATQIATLNEKTARWLWELSKF